jgi:hypothetical protein
MIDKVIKIATNWLWLVILFFLIRIFLLPFFSKPVTIYDYIGYAGEAITITLFIFGFYNSIFWRFNPFQKIPRLYGKYIGRIDSSYKNNQTNKKIKVEIQQTMLSVNVKITTDEITSNSIVSNLIEENGEYILYYTYLTNPQSKYKKENPILHGTCRLFCKTKTELQGKYWTTSNTTGDITLTKIVKKNNG